MPHKPKQKVAIVGGGACSLMLGAQLDSSKFDVSIYEKNAAPGRKFLVAGEGGLNITHSEEAEKFIARYTPNGFLKKAFTAFSNRALINWLSQSGIETYTGSSGRVFPKKGIKPIEVLNALLRLLEKNKVTLLTKHEWQGFTDEGELIFKTDSEIKHIKSDYVIFCLGGASWPVTGSNAKWTDYFKQKNIQVNKFEASNCAFKINWPADLIPRIEGKALKNVSFTCAETTIDGEAVLTSFGIEGSGVYPLSPLIRSQLQNNGEAQIKVDMKPTLSKEALLKKLGGIKNKSNYTQQLIRQLNLNSLQLNLIKYYTGKEEFLNPEKLVNKLKSFTLTVSGTDKIENAISTVGGIALNEIDKNFELKKWPNHFAIGEMLDYDAPTGGYLLQSCFTMAAYLATYFNQK